MKKTLLLTAVLCGALGCGKAPTPEKTAAQPAPPAPVQSSQPAPASQPAEPAAPAQPSSMQTIVDGFTGRGAIKQGKAATETIKAVSAKEQGDLEDALKP
jgi:hypothetical protein